MTVKSAKTGRRIQLDFGIKGKRAIVCAGGKGLEKDCAVALAGDGVSVTMVAHISAAPALAASPGRIF
jgi:3-oxoacyl-[acyl-carrier protein] reductase